MLIKLLCLESYERWNEYAGADHEAMLERLGNRVRERERFVMEDIQLHFTIRKPNVTRLLSIDISLYVHLKPTGLASLTGRDLNKKKIKNSRDKLLSIASLEFVLYYIFRQTVNHPQNLHLRLSSRTYFVFVCQNIYSHFCGLIQSCASLEWAKCGNVWKFMMINMHVWGIPLLTDFSLRNGWMFSPPELILVCYTLLLRILNKRLNQQELCPFDKNLQCFTKTSAFVLFTLVTVEDD